ncbi:lysophospholipid acyltransferase family protein [Gloeobacter kilaueensis]|nr:lysophospholipid acyltransferase family protein [Gloeobacter kilaueensis]
MLELFRTQVHVTYQQPLPAHEGCLLVVSGHRSFLDAPVLLWGMGRPIRLVCHHYLGQVPLVNELVRQLGGFHMGPQGQGWSQLFARAAGFLQAGTHVAIFPEGAQLITTASRPAQVARFRRGFAHLALRSGIVGLPVVPVAIVSRREASGPLVPLRLLSLFDQSEPMFQRSGWHPYVVYEQVELRVGSPRRLVADEFERYRSGEAAAVTAALASEMEQAARQLTASGATHPW